jgi:hypothetical protein
MRLSQTTEWVLIAVLILYIAFTPGIPMVRDFMRTSIGKAVSLAVIVYVWKYVSEPVALLLTVHFVRCSGMREGMTNPTTPPPPSMTPPATSSTAVPMTTPTAPSTTGSCPDGYTLENGQCKNKEGQSTPVMMGPSSTSTTAVKQPFTNMTPAYVPGGAQPDAPKKENFAPF